MSMSSVIRSADFEPLFLLVGVVAASGPLGARGEENVVRARSIEITDDEGRVRARLFVNEAGPRLVLFDEAGRHRLALALQVTSPGPEIFEEKGRHAIEVRHLNGRPVVSLYDDHGLGRLTLEAPTADAPGRVRSQDARGEVPASWPAKDRD